MRITALALVVFFLGEQGIASEPQVKNLRTPAQRGRVDTTQGTNPTYDYDEEDQRSAASRISESQVRNLEDQRHRSLHPRDLNVMSHNKEFKALSCNANLSSASCTPWSTFSSSLDLNAKVVIPCGSCVTMDVTDGSTVALPGGLDVVGKLDLQATCRVTIETTFVLIQGELAITSDEPVDGNEKIKFVLTGDEFHYADEHLHSDPGGVDNTALCPGSTCKMGVKPVAAVGGKFNIQGLPDQCPTWVNLLDVVRDGTATPTDFPGSFQLVPECSSRELLNENFENTGMEGTALSYGVRVNTFWGNWGASSQVINDGTDTYLHVTGRGANWQGPIGTLPLDCAVADEAYFITARLRISVALTDSWRIKLIHKRVDGNGGGHYRLMGDHKTPIVAGEWFTFTAVNSFTQAEIDDADQSLLYFETNHASADVDLDFLSVNLAPVAAYPDPASPCTELIQNGDASISGAFTYPFKENGWGSHMIVTDDGDSNPYFKVVDRDIPNVSYSGFRYSLTPGCIIENTAYTFTMKTRIHNADAALVHPKVSLKTKQPSGQEDWDSIVSNCDIPDIQESDGWVTCSSTFTFDSQDASASSLYVYAELVGDHVSDWDFDDISFTAQPGPVTGLVVSSDVSACWGVGSEILVTSHTLDYDDGSALTITSSSTALDRTTLTLSGSHVPTVDTTPDYATEVALLSRNVRFESEADSGIANGGHLIVLHTPSVMQKLDGVEMRRFGQQGTLGRYPIHFHMSGSCVGSVVSRNAIRESNQRCVVIHGSHDITISENIAYDTFGHCYMLEDGGEHGNFFLSNLGALTKRITSPMTDETDNEPSTYWNTNANNTWIGNVAAGSAHSGFWFEFRTFVRGPSGNLDEYDEVNPSKIPLEEFRDNIAHSNYEHGFKTYPGSGYDPPTRQSFINTKSYRNKGSGVFIHNSMNVVMSGGLYADNRRQVDIDRSPGCAVVGGARVVGVSPEFQIVAEGGTSSVHCPSSYPLVGVQLHTYWSGGPEYLGADVHDVTFEHLNDNTGCSGSAAMSIDKENKGYFDVRTSVSNLNFIDTPVKLTACESAEEEGIDNVAIHDLDGSLSGSVGYVVSNSDRMKAFTSCVSDNTTCTATCANACFRTMGIAVSNYEPDDLTLEITDMTTGATSVIRGFYDWPLDMDTDELRIDEHSKSWRTRRFFATLPAGGSYSAKFVLNGVDHWPMYVKLNYEDADGACGPDFVTFDIFQPPVPAGHCDELIANGNIEAGIEGWWATSGGLQVTDGASGLGITNEYRYSTYYGLAQYLDTRCIQTGDVYEVKAKIKVTNGYNCDVGANNCPQMILNTFDAIYQPDGGTWDSVARASKTWKVNDWNDLEGIWTVTATQAYDLRSIMVYLSGPATNYDIVVDYVSIVPYEPEACSSVIVDDNFADGDSMGWDGHGAPWEVTPEHYFLVMARSATWHGPKRNLPVDCIASGATYMVSGKARLTCNDGHTSECSTATGWNSRCLRLTLYTEDRPPNAAAIKDWVGVISGLGEGVPDGNWFNFLGTTVFSDAVLDTTNLYARRLYFEGPEELCDIAVDDVKIELSL